jgi:NADPH:quinone reductase
LRAALITELGRLPEIGEAPDPVRGDGEALIRVLAVPLNPIDVNVGAGRFYGGSPALPYVPACECVGRVHVGAALTPGTLVWAHGAGMGTRRDGALAELLAVAEDVCVPLPEGFDPALAGALGVAGLAGWLPVAFRAPVREGETVLVLGATGTAGLVAVEAARLLGAGRIVAAGRNPEALARAVERGADAAVQIGDGFVDALRKACGEGGATLIVDPLWGEPLAAALEVAAPGARVVHLGQSAGPTTTLKSGTVRGKQLDVLGLSVFGVSRDVLTEEYARLVRHALAGDITVDVERVPLDDVADAWRRQAEGTHHKLVLVP